MELERKILCNSLSVVDEVPLLIERVASRLDIAQEERGALNLVLEEALVNVVNYAYPSGVKGDIDLEVRFDEADRALTFIIRDSGKPFDPTLAAEADVDAPLEDRRIGGLGIQLIRTLMDSVSYSYTGGCNELTLIKYLSSKQ